MPFSKDIVDVVMLGAELLCYTEKEHVRITNCVASSVYLMCNILNDERLYEMKYTRVPFIKDGLVIIIYWHSFSI